MGSCAPTWRNRATGGKRHARYRFLCLAAAIGAIAVTPVAHAVRACVDKGCDLSDLSLADLKKFSPLIEADVSAVLTLEGSVAARDHIGGTAPAQVRAAIARARSDLA